MTTPSQPLHDDDAPVTGETFRQFEQRNEAEHRVLEAKVDSTRETLEAKIEALRNAVGRLGWTTYVSTAAVAIIAIVTIIDLLRAS